MTDFLFFFLTREIETADILFPFRINAIMMNTPEFAEVFNCSNNSRMVAHQTCHIFWWQEDKHRQNSETRASWLKEVTCVYCDPTHHQLVTYHRHCDSSLGHHTHTRLVPNATLLEKKKNKPHIQKAGCCKTRARARLGHSESLHMSMANLYTHTHPSLGLTFIPMMPVDKMCICRHHFILERRRHSLSRRRAPVKF